MKTIFLCSLVILSGCASLYSLKSQEEYDQLSKKYDEFCNMSNVRCMWPIPIIGEMRGGITFSDYIELSKENNTIDITKAMEYCKGQREEETKNYEDSGKFVMPSYARVYDKKYYYEHSNENNGVGKCINSYKSDIENKEEEAVEQKANEEEQEYITKKVKQYGKPFCDGMLGQYALRKMQLPKNCIFKQGFPMNVLQQTTEGTIVSFEYYEVDGTYLITKNPKDASLVDGQRIEYGLFENIGTFEYVSVLGAPRTILKLRRIE